MSLLYLFETLFLYRLSLDRAQVQCTALFSFLPFEAPRPPMRVHDDMQALIWSFLEHRISVSTKQSVMFWERWCGLRMIKYDWIWIVFGCSWVGREALEVSRPKTTEPLCRGICIRIYAIQMRRLYYLDKWLDDEHVFALRSCEVSVCLNPAHGQMMSDGYLQPSAKVINVLIQSLFQS